MQKFTTYISKDGQKVIAIQYAGLKENWWALFINGQYKKTEVIPKNNTAIVQNFRFLAEDFFSVRR